MDVIETTLGTYKYYTDEEGNTIITDYYDFTSGKNFVNTLFAPLLGSSKDGEKRLKWHINLGKL